MNISKVAGTVKTALGALIDNVQMQVEGTIERFEVAPVRRSTSERSHHLCSH